jgi:ribosomal protein S18 acetylase RimI-like enzyme
MTGMAPSEPSTATWTVRRASSRDVDEMGIAVEELLLELGGKPPHPVALRDAICAVIADRSLGELIVAESEQGEIVGFLGVSWQTAVRIPGRYGLIQELWVHPKWRSREIGKELLEGLEGLARESGISRIEVGLPSERFAHLQATEAFYRSNGFQEIGLRMKLLLEDERSDEER